MNWHVDAIRDVIGRERYQNDNNTHHSIASCAQYLEAAQYRLRGYSIIRECLSPVPKRQFIKSLWPPKLMIDHSRTWIRCSIDKTTFNISHILEVIFAPPLNDLGRDAKSVCMRVVAVDVTSRPI